MAGIREALQELAKRVMDILTDNLDKQGLPHIPGILKMAEIPLEVVEVMEAQFKMDDGPTQTIERQNKK